MQIFTDPYLVSICHCYVAVFCDCHKGEIAVGCDICHFHLRVMMTDLIVETMDGICKGGRMIDTLYPPRPHLLTHTLTGHDCITYISLDYISLFPHTHTFPGRDPRQTSREEAEALSGLSRGERVLMLLYVCFCQRLNTE